MWDYFLTFYVGRGFGVSYILTNVFQCVCVPFMLTRFAPDRKYFLRKAIEVPAVWAAYILLSSLYFMLFGMAGMPYHVYVTYPLLIAVYAAVFSDQRPAMRITNAFLLASVFAVSVRLSEAIGILIRGASGRDLYGFAFAANVVMTLGSIVFVNAVDLGRQPRVPYLAAAMIAVVSVISIAAQLLLPSSADASGFIIFLNTSLWAIEIFTYYMVYMIVRSQNENMSLLAEKRAMENDNKILRLSEKNFEKLREIRHDIKNQLSTVKVLIEQGQYDEAIRFFDGMQQGLLSRPGVLTMIDCGNKIVSAILNMEMEKAAAAGIKLDAKIAVPGELPFAENDLCSLLTNLIDNAAEATAACGSDEPVELSMSAMYDYLFIRVRNAVDARKSAEEILSFKTSKDAEIHGCGTKIINKIVTKYDGAIKNKVADDHFVADIMLRLCRGGGN